MLFIPETTISKQLLSRRKRKQGSLATGSPALALSLPASKQPWKRRSSQAAAEGSKKQLNLKHGYYTKKQALTNMSKLQNKTLLIYWIICILYTWYLVAATKSPVACCAINAIALWDWPRTTSSEASPLGQPDIIIKI